MNIDNYLNSYSSPKAQSSIIKLTESEKIWVKEIIDKIISQTGKDFQITELNVLSDTIEISLNHKFTLFRENCT